MEASILDFVTGVLAMMAGLGLVALAGVYFLWRMARRRLGRLRSHGAVVGALALWQFAGASRWGQPAGVPALADILRWTGARARKEMWRSVDAAAAAVRTADGVGAPVADLHSLCRRMSEVARELDAVLRMDPAHQVPAVLAGQVAELLRAADDVRAAVQSSASEVSADRVRLLTEEAGRELSLLDTGLAARRSLRPGEWPPPHLVP